MLLSLKPNNPLFWRLSMTPPSTTPTPPDTFIADAKLAVADVRRALAQLVESVGANPQQPQEISRRFGLDKTLTWKVARFIGDDDMLAAASHLPGRASVRNLVEAMHRQGAPAESASSVLEAMDRLDALVTAHAGDRDTFEVMLGSASDELARKRGEAARKQLFLGGSAVWGVQAKAHLSIQIAAPSKDNPDKLDLGVIGGFVDFRRLRSDVPWTVARRLTFSMSDGMARPSPNIHPMDESLDRDAPPLLAKFSSTPAPVLRMASSSGKNVARYEIVPGPIGKNSAATCMVGWIARNETDWFRTPGDDRGEHIVRLSTPAQMLYHDLYVHKSLGFAMNPRAAMYSDLPGGPTYPLDGPDAGMLPIGDEVIDLGFAPANTVTSDIPGYREMVRYAIERMGWDEGEFRGFRQRLRYPPIPALAMMRYDLPER